MPLLTEWPEVKDFARCLGGAAVARSGPAHFTAALPKRNARAASSSTIGAISAALPRSCPMACVLPQSALAAPVTWKEMETIDRPSR